MTCSGKKFFALLHVRKYNHLHVFPGKIICLELLIECRIIYLRRDETSNICDYVIFLAIVSIIYCFAALSSSESTSTRSG